MIFFVNKNELIECLKKNIMEINNNMGIGLHCQNDLNVFN